MYNTATSAPLSITATQDSYNPIFRDMSNLFSLLKTDLSNLHRTLSFGKIQWDKYSIQLNQEISIQISFIDGFWEGHNEDLDIFVIALDVEQCKNYFQEEICTLWEEYANESDDRLTLDAQRLKYKLLDLVKGVDIEDQD